MKPLRVLAVASECYPFVKTGGLADVVGALPVELNASRIESRTLLPGYPDVLSALPLAEEVLHVQNFFGGPIRLLAASHGGADFFVLDAPQLFARPGNPYVSADGKDWPDNAQRFAALCKVAAEIGVGAVSSFVPDVVHCHDWQTGLTPAYLHYAKDRHRPASIMTVHNLAYQGKFSYETVDAVGLPPESFTMHGVEYYGGISYLKAGLRYADHITTVSPTYAREILQDENGMGMAGLLRERSSVLTGILNGIDISVWNPETDASIASQFNVKELNRRLLNKKVLQQRVGLEQNDNALLLGVVSRLSWQKGLDLLLENVPSILDNGMQLVLLGNGEHDLQENFQFAGRSNPGRIAITIGYDEERAHLIQAGVDALVVPSRFEPCGLTQLCAMRYGAVPVVANVGGLADTVIDGETVGWGDAAATGFTFEPVTGKGLRSALMRVATMWRDQEAWRRLQCNGMLKDVSWRNRAGRYAELYREAASAKS